MKDQFCDYETAKMLKNIGFDEPCMALYKDNGHIEFYKEGVLGRNKWINESERIAGKNKPAPFFGDILTLCATAPLWQQVKEWLWEKHHAYIRVVDNGDETFDCWNEFLREGLTRCKSLDFDSPIEAEIEGIKQAVKYLHSKIK